MADADKNAPGKSLSVTVRTDTTSDGTFWGPGMGRLVASRDYTGWHVDHGHNRSASNRAEGRMYYPDYADAIKQQIYKGMDSWFGAVRLVEARMQTGELRNWFDSGVPVDAAVERIVNNYQEPEKGPEYGGEPMPKWVKEGARVRVKATPWLRQYGIKTTAGVSHSSDDRAWPGDVGVIRRTDRQSWHWYVQFERDRETGLDIETLDKLVRVKA